MKIIDKLLAALFLLVAPMAAVQAQPASYHLVTGFERMGGNPFAYLKQAEIYRQQNVKVIIGDQCWSSCTLYTTLLRDNLICAEPGARFFFHRFTFNDVTERDSLGDILAFRVGPPVLAIQPSWFNELWASYPLSVRHRLMQERPQDGLPPVGEETIITATDLVPPC